ncbi:hypothetical protein B0J17DRAFT_716754 [Rhizoctonia solani]|nr:hypothetical protein B0J17DRAFT_716754 [Rhizoctonia solani]
MLSLHKFALLAFCTTPSFVSAHITPTVPTAGAQYQGGQTQVLKWSHSIDDKDGNPFSAERFKCDLMWGNNHWVTLLARNMSIYDEWVAVHFRPDYGFDSTAYYVRYMTEETSSIVNTNRFTLSQMNGTNFSRLFNEHPDPNVVSHGSGGSPLSNAHTNPSASTAQAGNSLAPAGARPTPTSSLSGNEDNQGASQTNGPIRPLGTSPSPSLDDTEDSEPKSAGNQSGAVSLTRQRESAWQKVSLVLWPVLVGAMMAM